MNGQVAGQDGSQRIAYAQIQSPEKIYHGIYIYKRCHHVHSIHISLKISYLGIKRCLS